MKLLSKTCFTEFTPTEINTWKNVEKAMKSDKRKLLVEFSRNLPIDVNLHLVQYQLNSLPKEERAKWALLSLFLEKKGQLKNIALIPDIVSFYTWLYDTFLLHHHRRECQEDLYACTHRAVL